MKTRERIIGNRIFVEIVADDGEDCTEAPESVRVIVIVDLVPDHYGEL